MAAIDSRQFYETSGETSQPANKFCPDSGLLSAAGMEVKATGTILLMLLRPLALIMLVGSLAYIGRDLLIDDHTANLVCYLATVVIGALTLRLFAGQQPSLAHLRVIELGLFLVTAVQIGTISYLRIVAAGAAGDAGQMVSQLNLTLTEFTVLMGAYAIFIPNTATRASFVVGPLVLATPLVWGAVSVNHPELTQSAAPLLGVREVTDLGLLTAISATVCLLGARLITRYRTTALEARAANLYDLRHKIGEGGMGEVWLAQHQALARPAAIKIVRPELLTDGNSSAGKNAVKRFEREARATAALTSPHTVDIYDFGVTQDGIFYYVMEYLDGVDFGSLVKRHGPLPAARVVYLLRQACASLADAHNRELIHRDIKPANLFACRMGTEFDFVKVLDFGLVKDQRPGDRTQLTVDGLTTGTPAYMAPEMALQDGRIGPATDIYALGCVGYWLLTGKLVFDDVTPVAMIVSHVKTEPEPPSARTELPIPPALDEILLRCLRKDPADRFASMKELARALATVDVGDPWDDDEAERWWSLHHPGDQVAELARAS